MTRYELFDRKAVRLGQLSERGHQILARDCLELAAPSSPCEHHDFPAIVASVLEARKNGRPVILMMGAHPIKLGLSRFLIDLMERSLITLVATNGAGIIHDFELALAGGTSEDVAKWIAAGQFGLWRETTRVNEIVATAAKLKQGLGEAIGQVIEEESFPHRDLSIAAAGWRLGIPVTSHVSIGSDITHAHPNFDGAAFGAASDTDFLIFSRAIQDLEGGVYLNIGTAVTGPEVFLKALAMARNVAHARSETIRRFTIGVFDLAKLPATFAESVPSSEADGYYFRPWKTLLVRCVSDFGTAYYFCGDHRVTIPTLWHRLILGSAPL